MATGERTRYYQQRPRRVPPEFATDERLEGCSLVATLLLYRLISLADDQGRQAGSAASVRARAFPLRDRISKRRIQTALAELAAVRFVLHYEVDSRWFLQIVRWWDLQGRWGERRRYPSQYPAPAGWTEDWVTPGLDAEEVPALGPHDAGELPSPFSLPSAFSSTVSTPDSLQESQPSGPETLGAILHRVPPKRLTDAEAMELGRLVAADEQSRSRTRT